MALMPPDAGGTSLTRHCVVMGWFPRLLIDAVLSFKDNPVM